AESQPWGFSPGLASRLTLESGARAFVKAIAPDEVSGAPQGQDIYRSEGRVAAALPEQVPAPRLIASLEPDGWVALLFEDVEGEHPSLPWRHDQLGLVLDAIAALSDALTPSPLSAPPAA